MATRNNSAMENGEFGFIEKIKTIFGTTEDIVGIGDDCAVIPMGENDLLVTTDMLIEGVHFLRSDATPEQVGYKSVAVNLSDIAAMGGRPIGTFLSIALPKDAQGEWAERFMAGFAEISRHYGVPLLGGDTTSSLRDVAVNVAVVGTCPHGAILRSGARVGDTIFVTGPLGDSGAGLKLLLERAERTPDEDFLVGRHYSPTPRLSEGLALAATGLVGAMMDISDGIASDLGHILRASGVGARVALDALLTSEQLERVCGRKGWSAFEIAASAGEDYELLLTAPEEITQMVDFPLYPIGRITEGGAEIEWHKGDERCDFTSVGFTHF